MASIQFKGKGINDIGEFCGYMFKSQKTILRPVGDGFDAIRMSMAYYNTEDEYEQFSELCEREFF